MTEQKRFEVILPRENPRDYGLLAAYPPAAPFMSSLMCNIPTDATIWIRFIRPVYDLVSFSVIDVLKPWTKITGQITTSRTVAQVDMTSTEFDKMEFKLDQPLEKGFFHFFRLY